MRVGGLPSSQKLPFGTSLILCNHCAVAVKILCGWAWHGICLQKQSLSNLWLKRKPHTAHNDWVTRKPLQKLPPRLQGPLPNQLLPATTWPLRGRRGKPSASTGTSPSQASQDAPFVGTRRSAPQIGAFVLLTAQTSCRLQALTWLR